MRKLKPAEGSGLARGPAAGLAASGWGEKTLLMTPSFQSSSHHAVFAFFTQELMTNKARRDTQKRQM